ncbi:hypothetical protein GCM10008966_17380 [Rhodovulum strictum]
MGGGGGGQARVKFKQLHAAGLAQGVHRVQHPVLDARPVRLRDAVDLRQGPAVGPKLDGGGRGACRDGKGDRKYRDQSFHRGVLFDFADV